MKHTIEQLRHYLNYDSETGSLTWKNPPKQTSIKGKNSCSFDKKLGYLRVRINKKSYYAHRLAWVIYYGEWPEKSIRFIDHDKKNISIANLSQATQHEIVLNSGDNKNNTLGFRGIAFRHGKWAAAIGVNYKKIHLGTFNTKQEAAKAYKKAHDDILSMSALTKN